MTPRLEEFTTEQLKFALSAIQTRLIVIGCLNDEDKILSGDCPEWDALTLWKVQLTMALERSEKVDK